MSLRCGGFPLNQLRGGGHLAGCVHKCCMIGIDQCCGFFLHNRLGAFGNRWGFDW